MTAKPLMLGLVTIAVFFFLSIRVFGQSTNFTYQGKLTDGGNPANGSYDLQFSLFDASSGGAQIGSTLILSAVAVSNGSFTAQLDFGAGAFPGASRFLEIGTRAAGGGSFTILAPRQQISATPYAVRSLSASTADTAINATQLGGTAAGQYVQSTDSRLSDARAPTAGSASYIQNSTSQQPANFNISGNGFFGGNVGIGTASPAHKLEVNGIARLGNAGGVYGYLLDLPSPGPYPTIGFNNYWNGTGYAAGMAGTGGVFQYQNVDGKLIYYTASTVPTGSLFSFSPRVTITNSGKVGIGTINPLGLLEIRTANSSDSNAIDVKRPDGGTAFVVEPDGKVFLSLFGSSTTHVCNFLGYLSFCSSAAEYVPTPDSGSGSPDTGDLVSIMPTVTNPYGDTHAPFVVQKSSTPCDANLLGFMVKPESGADGVKLNEHYLPLAIFGYFPAKVTLENGPIKRGDPITSSSKPGYGMRATQACKIVGYALEDADQEGRIQVFAHLSEYTAPVIAALHAGTEQLNKTVESLKKDRAKQQAQNDALAARVAAVEQAAQAQQRRSSELSLPSNCFQRRTVSLQVGKPALRRRTRC